MKVETAIKFLQEKDPDEDLIMAWWDSDGFELEKKDWKYVAALSDNGMNWSNAHENISDFINYYLDERKTNDRHLNES